MMNKASIEQTVLGGHLLKATITRRDLSARFFCIDATLLCKFVSDKMLIDEFEWNRGR